MSWNDSNKITVIIPALNEEEGIRPTLEGVLRLEDVGQIIVVDGGSLDGTAEIAERIGATVIIERRTGWGGAVIRGLQEARGEFIAVIDADYTYDPSEIPKLITVLKSNDSIAAVVGTRSQKSLAVKFFASMFRLLFNSPIDDVTSSFIVARKDPVMGLQLRSWDFSLSVEILAKLIKKGYMVTGVPIIHRPRLGEKKLKLRHGYWILRRIIASRF